MIIDARPTEDEIIKAEIENLTQMIREIADGIKQAEANLTKIAVIRDCLLKSIEDLDQQLIFDFDTPDVAQIAN